MLRTVIIALHISLCICIIAPNTSLATVPIAYFGGNFAHRNASNIEMLAKCRIVMLEKWEGQCWQNCLNGGPGSQDCLSSCGVETYIMDTMRRIKAINPSVATVLYWNTLLAFPFYTAVGKFAAENALTIDSSTGKPIKIRNDNGMEDIGVYGFDTSTGVQLYIETVKNLTSIDGLVDGFFGDKWDSGAKKSKHGQWQICNHECGNVTAAQAAAWNKGKAAALAAVTKYVGKGPYFSNGVEFMGVTANLNGHWQNDPTLKSGDPRKLIQDVKDHLANHSYFYMSCTDDQKWTVDPNAPDTLKSDCDEQALVRFLLGVEEGCFFGTNGWDPVYALPLGDPKGAAVYTPASTTKHATLTRNFTSGTFVTFMYNAAGTDGSGEIWWGGHPPTPPAMTCGNCSSTVMGDTTFAYDDISAPTVVQNAAACCASCALNQQCIQWAWHGSTDQSCHLHGTQADQKPQTGTSAGIMNRTSPLF